jgi:hypothetical protein
MFRPLKPIVTIVTAPTGTSLSLWTYWIWCRLSLLVEWQKPGCKSVFALFRIDCVTYCDVFRGLLPVGPEHACMFDCEQLV